MTTDLSIAKDVKLTKPTQCQSCAKSEAHLRVSEALQQVVLQLFESNGVLSKLAHQTASLLLQVWSLMIHNLCQQLLFQSNFCHTEVNQSGWGCNFRLVVRVGQLSL